MIGLSTEKTQTAAEAGASQQKESDAGLNIDYMQVVAFTLADENYAVPITNVKEIILVGTVTQVPQMPSCILGVINLRGQVIPVIDLRTRLELPARAMDDQTRIMIVRLEDRIVGLVVDAVSQVMKIRQGAIQPPPELMSGPAQRFISGIARLEAGILICLDIQKILNRTDLTQMSESLAESTLLRTA